MRWSDGAEIAKDNDVFVKMCLAVFGTYVWEIFLTIDFEWSLVQRRRPFRWPLVFFFLCRYAMLGAFLAISIAFAIPAKLSCQALYDSIFITSNLSILGASTSLLISAFKMVDRERLFIVPVALICISHWALQIRAMFIGVSWWSDEINTCLFTQSFHWLSVLNFFYTTGVDLIALALAATSLLRLSPRPKLLHLLFHDGVFYFGICVLVNIIPAVLCVLDLNTSMNTIASVPAATLSTIASCRLVMLTYDRRPDRIVRRWRHSTVDARRSPRKQELSKPDALVTTDRRPSSNRISLSELSPTIPSHFDDTKSTEDISEYVDSSFRTSTQANHSDLHAL